jgi:ATP-binding protein involved in chromosome partitioning
MSEVKARVLKALSQVIDPELRRPITELGMVGDVLESADVLEVAIKLTVSHCPAANEIEDKVSTALREEFGAGFKVNMQVMSPEELNDLKAMLRGSLEPKTNPFTEGTSTRVFLFGSGKGGVGKSTITANVAVHLAKLGHSVGLIDADIFGFSIPDQLGLTAKPTRLDDMILPPVIHGVKVISIGMFLPGNEPVAWRGPMLHKAIEQFLTDVYWGQLDFLLIDMPPGTGDVAISVGQLLPTAKSIVITTPQLSAAVVAERSGTAGHPCSSHNNTEQASIRRGAPPGCRPRFGGSRPRQTRLPPFAISPYALLHKRYCDH